MLQAERQQKDIFIRKSFYKFFAPSLLSCLGLAIGGLADCVFVGNTVGTVGLTAISIGQPIYMLFNTVSYSLSIGGSIHYGNSTLLLIAGMMGINPSLYEAADIDGASGWQKFTRVTIPLLKPVLLYVLVTSAIGGLQLYDIPALFNTGNGGGLIGLPDDTSTTVTMYIMRLHASDTGRAAAVSVLLFIITLIISLIFFRAFRDDKEYKSLRAARRRRRGART